MAWAKQPRTPWSWLACSLTTRTTDLTRFWYAGIGRDFSVLEVQNLHCTNILPVHMCAWKGLSVALPLAMAFELTLLGHEKTQRALVHI